MEHKIFAINSSKINSGKGLIGSFVLDKLEEFMVFMRS